MHVTLKILCSRGPFSAAFLLFHFFSCYNANEVTVNDSSGFDSIYMIYMISKSLGSTTSSDFLNTVKAAKKVCLCAYESCFYICTVTVVTSLQHTMFLLY